MAAKRRKAAPTKTVENGHDGAGRFALGNPGGPGRPRRPDLLTLAQKGAAASGVSLEAEVWAVCQRLIVEAKAGNVPAAKLILERFTDPDPVQVEHSGKLTLEQLVLRSLGEGTKDAAGGS